MGVDIGVENQRCFLVFRSKVTAKLLTLVWGSLLASVLTVGSVNAEMLGLVNGRSADLSILSDTTVELGFSTGDDIDSLVGRINYRLSPGLIAFADLASSEFGWADGIVFGFGVYYQLQDLLSGFDSALKAGFHRGSLEGVEGDEVGVSPDRDLDELTLELLISGRTPINDQGLEWYANLGISRLSVESVTNNEVVLGGGILLPVGFGEVYAGIDLIDEIMLGIGFRYYMN